MPHLEAILADTRRTLLELHRRRGELERTAAAMPLPPDFRRALLGEQVALIAEIKRRSPSAGAINPGLEPVALARQYEEGGAAAISVLTDAPHFGGSLADLEQVVGAVRLPVLRKDFFVDEAQIVEARAAGAAAILLIARVLDDATLRRLLDAARGLGLAALVETHTASEIDRALAAGADIIGVNARDLDTFTIDTVRAWELLARVPAGRVAVAESGMATRADVERAAARGADAVLIGSALSAAGQPADAARALAGVSRRGR